MMDTFIDKLAQKFTAQEMIKANMAAEAKENRKLREQIENYESMLKEFKDSSIGNKEYLEELFTKADDSLHKENVKVYRNVQAAINDGLKEQTETLLEEQRKTSKKQGVFLKVMSILIFVAVLADIALQVLRILEIF